MQVVDSAATATKSKAQTEFLNSICISTFAMPSLLLAVASLALVAAHASSDASSQPNILLLFPDQWRYDWDGFTRRCALQRYTRRGWTHSRPLRLPRSNSGTRPSHPSRLPLTSNQPNIPGPLLRVPTTRAVAARGTRFTTAYVPAPVCAPSRSCLAAGREYDEAGVPSNRYDYPIKQTTFYTQLRSSGYHVMTTGKDDLTKKSQLGSKTNYPGCPTCVAGDGR